MTHDASLSDARRTAARCAAPASDAPSPDRPYLVALDSANEMVTLGVARISDQGLHLIDQQLVAARRASNTQLLPRLSALLDQLGIERHQVGSVVVGRGPGSFTGVRIALATAKGMAQAAGCALVGVSTLDAIAFNAQISGVRGEVGVVADAMRGEVYPVRYRLTDQGVERCEADAVLKAPAAAERWRDAGLQLTGDGLAKHAALFSACGAPLPRELWNATGAGLVACAEAAWRGGGAHPFDARAHRPGAVLPVYTRLSDAEEAERARLAMPAPRNLVSGVQSASGARAGSMHARAAIDARQAVSGVAYRPLDADRVSSVAAIEAAVMSGDPWSEPMLASELSAAGRVWWVALAPEGADAAGESVPLDDLRVVGYAGCLVVDGEMQVLRVGVSPDMRRHGIARELLERCARDARDLGAARCSLEVRAGNASAQGLYRSLGLQAGGVRPRYYADGEDALIMAGPLPIGAHRAGGMSLRDQVSAAAANGDPDAAASVVGNARSMAAGSVEGPVRPLILAIESSCDETGAAVIDGEGTLLADVVASQVDFHARFGGVVPEIASRKHVEAICGVCEECLEQAGARLGQGPLAWADLDAVAVTYAPGLMGALVVGVAFAKGAAWAQGLPFIGVNHLEGHLHANKLGAADLRPPLVASLVSGGNTLLVEVRDWGDYRVLGETIDDAVGEAFDKVAKALGLGYPGGPVISRLAAQGNPDAIAFPRAMLHSGNLDFSLSGLKTAVTSYIGKEREVGRPLNVPDIAASFQQAVIDVQVAKALRALEETGATTFCLGGGVAANPALRAAYQQACDQRGVRLVLPPLSACGDHAGMIALVALERFRQGRFFGLDADAQARCDLERPY
ncbi:tRNA (adenosine(37)-N6)-threonylcarbamoyltransferase complex transferase subunit TsaD [Berryella wangjianweii]|nr:tRNA (adenosine(37)-N6)-threonylcarbamoyltransferase complex transferase subunit TsaD [Berryella wangjianweii]